MLKTGDTVVCINDSVPANFHFKLPIKKGTEYTIRNVIRSPCCGYLWVDVGFTAISPFQACISCEKQFLTTGVWWFDYGRFAPVIPKQELEEMEITESTYNGVVIRSCHLSNGQTIHMKKESAWKQD